MFHHVLTDRVRIAEVFGLSEADLIPDLPIQPVDTGLGHLIVGVKSLEALLRVRRNIVQLRSLCADAGVREAQLFAFETYDEKNDIHTRNLCPREGVEDPACGVGNGALGAFLLKHRYKAEEKIALRAEQGHVAGMPSVIEIGAWRKNEQISVSIGGGGKLMSKGVFFL